MADSTRPPTHKRQKSLSLSVNYYFNPQPGGQQSQQPQPQQQPQQQHLHQPLDHETPIQMPALTIPQLLPSTSIHRLTEFDSSGIQHHGSTHLSAGHTPIHETYATAGSNTGAYTPYSIQMDPTTGGPPGDMNLVTSLPTFTTPGYPSTFSYTDATSYLGYNNEYSSYVFPKLVVTNVIPSTTNNEFNYPGSPVKQKRIQQSHNKNNLSISSHFNLFNLKEEFDPRSDQLALPQQSGSLSTSSLALQLHQHQHQQLHTHDHQQLPLLLHDNRNLSQAISQHAAYHQQPIQMMIQPSHSQSLPMQLTLMSSGLLQGLQPGLQPSTHSTTTLEPAFQSEHTTLVQDLLSKIPSVDGANVNNFLLDLINALHNQISLDNFYNVLYNENSIINQELDSINYSPQVVMNSTFTLESILGVFKSPQLITDHLGNVNMGDIKLTLVNYHELLRTFLAIKILKDILIQVPESAVELDHTLPRLSIYKNYYIVCQKLISIYPLLLNTALEQQKIILGQLKLGKLIKLVYPGLKIKRLGLRGESKYNYLGVMWNERIIKGDILDLCNQYDLSELATYFQKKGRKISGKRKFQTPRPRKRTVSGNKPLAISSSIKKEPGSEDVIFAPQLSFIKPFLKFPTFDDFLILSEKLWFENVAHEKSQLIDSLIEGDIMELIESIFINEIQSGDNRNQSPDKQQFQEDSLLLNSFFERVVSKYEGSDIPNIDLQIYLIVIVTLMPHLLLISQRHNHLDFLLDLRQNLIYFVNFYVEQITGGFSSFPSSNASIFCIILKKLINVNDLLITFIKLLMKEGGLSDTRSIMTADIQNYLILPLPLLLFENSQIEFNFKQDIVQNGLIFSLMGYNFTTNDEDLNNPLIMGGIGSGGSLLPHPPTSPASSTVLLMKFVREEALLIEHFFKVDLTNFLSSDLPINDNQPWTNLLSPQENFTLRSLLQLIDGLLLSEHFKSRYPILVYHNFISIILNDLLKHIYSKQQLQQIQLENSFGNWWVFNLFVEEYVRFLGEVVGLFDSI